MRRTLLVAGLLLVAAPTAAAADGLPVGNVDVGREGVTVPGAADRIVALRGRGSTLVERIETDGGRVQSTLRLKERLTVPGVALDGTADGRSYDGRTVVLIRPRDGHHGFPLRRTRLVVLGVKPLRVRRRITLRGDFSFDALSPDGSRMFVVNYVDPQDPRKYVVRSYDLERGRFDRGAIVDAREPDEDMRGYPVTRVTTQDGRWAYTLYDGGGEPFVHALDTRDRKAFCIDLPMLAGMDQPFDLRLSLSPGALSVLDGERPVASVDTKTMKASEPAAPRPRQRRAQAPAGGGDGGIDWGLALGLGVFAAVALAASRGFTRRRRRVPSGV
ncbi:MAG TPA: hypothetical protein VF549_03145 [Solirubrobacteraceae bacterium]|jgi:hypothetical protein